MQICYTHVSNLGYANNLCSGFAHACHSTHLICTSLNYHSWDRRLELSCEQIKQQNAWVQIWYLGGSVIRFVDKATDDLSCLTDCSSKFQGAHTRPFRVLFSLVSRTQTSIKGKIKLKKTFFSSALRAVVQKTQEEIQL